MLGEVKATSDEAASVVVTKQAELGDDIFMALFQRLALQMIDTVWVEHLEVMNYTRSSVNLRAYGQRDPLVEYRTEGTRLFGEMQAAVLHRMMEVLPRLQSAIIEREDEELKKQAEAALKSSEQPLQAVNTAGASAPRVSAETPGRNDMVTIMNGDDVREMKYKKAEPFIENGWKLKV